MNSNCKLPIANCQLNGNGNDVGVGIRATLKRTRLGVQSPCVGATARAGTSSRCPGPWSLVPGPFFAPIRCSRARTSGRRGFTFIEILATMLLMSIVLPSVMDGISLCLSTAGFARQESEAVALANGKLVELTTTGSWKNAALSGDFGTDWPDYQWSGQLSDWSPPGATIQQADSLPQGATLQQLDITVSWTARSRQRSVTLSTLVYTPATSGSTQ